MPTLTVPIIKVGNKMGATTEVEIPDTLEVLEDPKTQTPENCGAFRILTKEDGDKRVVWDSNDMRQIHDAKKMFRDLIESGLVPYRVDEIGGASDQVMDEFDPTAEEVIFAPVAAVAGG
jgi:hypothetical protein